METIQVISVNTGTTVGLLDSGIIPGTILGIIAIIILQRIYRDRMQPN